MPNPTIVSAALSDKDLRDSITKLVEDYKNSLNDMKTATTNAVKDIQETIKSIGSTKVDFSGTLGSLEKAKKKMAAAASGSGSTTPTKSSYDPGTLGYQENLLKVEEERRKNMKMGTAELQQQNVLIEKMSQRIKAEKETNKQATEKYFAKQMQGAISMPTKGLADAEAKLQRLVNLQNTLRGKGILDEAKMNRLQNAIDNVNKKIENLKFKKPASLKDVLGMDESSVEAIARKMQALKRVSIDPNNTAQVKQLGEEYQRLAKRQNEYLGKNLLIQKSNHMLASTFGYIRNRIIYAFTLGTLTQFFKDVRNIRAEYEMLDRSLGILVGDFERGTRIFNELNEMALKSPFTLIELGTAAKQLTAYNFAADEVVDTTRRLADISAALGVPMERLTYNLGQIKAQGALTARDARDFANAGLAIVPMLADMYTKQKAFGKEMTTTADVYDMMSKKMVSYGDVLSVLQKVTDEGGKFFNFQARQADTLKVQIANLSLAYNNMMNEIGADNKGLLSGSIRMVRSLFENWKTVANVIQQIIITFGAYKATAIVVTALNSRMFVGGALVGLRNYIRGIKAATGAMATFNAVTKLNPIGLLVSVLATVAGYFLLFRDNVQEASQEVEMFGESAAKSMNKVRTLQKILQGSANTSSTYKKTLSELSNVMSEYGIKLDAEKANRDEINKATEQTIQLIKEEAAERQRANNIAKGEENYNKGIKDAKDAFYSEISDISDLTDIDGQTKKFRKELEDNAQAISDVVATIVEDNISLVVGKSGDEATKGMLKIQEKVSGAMSSMGISSKATQYLLYNTDILRDLIIQTRKVSEEQLNYNNKIDSYYDAAKKATESTMTFTQKVEANARALQNTSNDALSLYNKIYDIVKIAQQNHTINFDLKLTADNPPKWMLDKSLPELQRLAQRFAAVAQSGGHIEGYDREGTYQQALRYASAARQKQETEERAARMKDNKTRTKQSDEIAKAIKGEISLVKELQGAYDTLTKKGDSHANAIAKVQDLYGKTIDLLNKNMDKFGLPRLDMSIIKGNNYNEVLAFFEKLRDALESKGLSNLERMEAVEGVVKEFRLKADTYNLDMITKGLNNELGKLKDEYELAVSLDADPEMGNMFLDMFGIDTSDFPKTIDEFMSRAQQRFDDARKELNLAAPLNIFTANTSQWYDWGKAVGYSTEQVDNFRKGFDGSVDVAKKWAQDIVKQTQDLQYKLADNNGKIAIEEEKLANLRQRLAQETNDKQKELLELQIQDQQNAIAKLKEEILQMLPTYQRLFGAVAEHSAYMTRQLANDYKKMLTDAQKRGANPDGTYTIIDPINKKSTSITKDRLGKEIKSVDKELRNTQGTVEKITEAFTKGEDGVVDWAHGIELVGGELQKMSELVGVVSEIASAFGNTEEYDETAEVLGDIGNTIAGLGQAAQGVAQIYSGDIIGGATNVVKGLWTSISTWFDNSDKRIQQSIKDSERAVKRLELAYVDLEQAVDSAYGTAVIGAKQAALANKELQLAEIQRQIQLEKSRKGKNRDEDKIIDLQKQYKELFYEIKNGYTEIVDDLMGTDVGSFAENLVSSMIAAFKQGEDYMKVFSDSFDEMIDNMIMKSIVSRVVSQYLDAIWEDVNKHINERTKEESEDAAKAQNEAVRRAGLSNDEARQEIASLRSNNLGEYLTALVSVTQKDIDDYKKAALEEENAMQARLKAASAFTGSDVDYVMQRVTEIMPELGQKLKDILGEYYKFGESSETQLSALQQGLQGVSEETAGAVEAYLNGMSQQAYLRNDLLTQIRDAVVGFSLDVQVATMSQILLQLQSSYTVQMSIQGILEGWSSPSGLAVRVEMQ